MPQLQVTDEIFTIAKRRALEGGYKSVEDYVADLLAFDEPEEPGEFDHLFTAERIAKIKAADAQIDAGEFFTADQVREHFERKGRQG